jgi:hypothetical protein
LNSLGTVNGYILNSKVAWCDLRDNKKMALFSARIVADAEDQTERTLSTKQLRRVPMLHAPEEPLASGEWPLDAQTQLPGLERVVVGEDELVIRISQFDGLGQSHVPR